MPLLWREPALLYITSALPYLQIALALLRGWIAFSLRGSGWWEAIQARLEVVVVHDLGALDARLLTHSVSAIGPATEAVVS